jgi:hypothetical protein
MSVILKLQQNARDVTALGTLIPDQPRLVQRRRDGHDIQHPCRLASRADWKIGALGSLLF